LTVVLAADADEQNTVVSHRVPHTSAGS